MTLGSLMLTALLAVPSSSTLPPTWTVTGTDVTFSMSNSELLARRGDTQLFSLHAVGAEFVSGFDYLNEPREGYERPDSSDWQAEASYEVLSVVGPWVSYQESNSGYTGGAHPFSGTSYVAVDVTKDPRAFSLLQVFSDGVVLQALRADAFIKQHIQDKEAFQEANSVEKLLSSLGPGEDCVGFDLYSVQRSVAFHHLERGKVAVRIAFGPAGEACRGNKFVVGLLLPIPTGLKPVLERAARQKEGFLMKDARTVHAPSHQVGWEPMKQPASTERTGSPEQEEPLRQTP